MVLNNAHALYFLPLHLLCDLCFRNFILDTCGSQSQDSRDKLLAAFISKDDVLRLLRAPETKHINDAVVKEVMRKLTNIVTHTDIQNACDDVGISVKGYSAIHRLLKDALMRKGIVENLFPAPHKVKLAKNVSNEDVFSKLGEYMHVEDTMHISGLSKKKPPQRRKGSNTSTQANVLDEKGFPYTKFNNIFVDLKKLQRAMISFYRLSPEGL